MPSERRLKRRFACDVETGIQTPQGASCAARAQDVSASGICIWTDQAVPVGSRIRLELRLVLSWAKSDPLHLPAVVVWCARSMGGHQIGARFLLDAITSDQLQQLAVLLKFLQGELELPTG